MEKQGFTLAELLTVIIVLGAFAIFAVYNMAPSKALNEKRITTMSHNFYSMSEGIFHNILANKAKGDITKMVDSNSDSKIDSKDLKNHYSYYMDGTDIDCDEIKLASSEVKDYLKKASCAEFEPNTKAGFYLNKDCDTDTFAYEYFDKDNNLKRDVEDACGYIVYQFKGAEGVVGQDLFVIPFGKRQLK